MAGKHPLSSRISHLTRGRQDRITDLRRHPGKPKCSADNAIFISSSIISSILLGDVLDSTTQLQKDYLEALKWPLHRSLGLYTGV